MSNLTNYAKKEFALLRGVDSEPDAMQSRMERHLLKMIDIFSEEGHSGFSANYAMSCLERLLRFKPLTPLTGEADEWNNVGDDTYQNKRCYSVFKKGDGKAYFLDGKIFSDDGGETWFINSDS